MTKQPEDLHVSKQKEVVETRPASFREGVRRKLKGGRNLLKATAQIMIRSMKRGGQAATVGISSKRDTKIIRHSRGKEGHDEKI